MTTTLAVNDDNDIFIDSTGNLVLVNDIVACMQAAQQAAQVTRGEMQYHVNRGVPNFRVVWSGHPSVAQFRAAVRQEILLTTDVVAVHSINARLVGEAAVYTAEIVTTFGPGVLNNGL